MSEKQSSEISLTSEKTSQKYILDALKYNQRRTLNRDDYFVSETCEHSTNPVEMPLDSLEIPEGFAHESSENSLPLPKDKKYFRIGEVASLLKVEPHVLRYWESEFKSIRPIKSKSGHRVYARKDVETLAQVKHLLHEEKFSIQGAKKKLSENRKKTSPTPEAGLNFKAQHTLKEIRDELKGLIQMMKTQVS